MVTDEQVQLFRDKMKQGHTQEAAAAAAGMKPRTAREWQNGPLPSQTTQSRNYRTRKDPFGDHWQDVVVPLLEADPKAKLEAKTIIAEAHRVFKVQIPTSSRVRREGNHL